MSQADYDTKLRNVHRFIPFLENMIIQLKDPKMKNREQQLSKMESLYQMITDKNKKLKIDTLQKCEEVIIKLYYKVKGENAALPPTYPPNRTPKAEEKRKPIDVYSLAAESLSKSNNHKELFGQSSGCSSSISKSPRPKSFAFRKPPISYSDLECLEKDVAHELEKKMSLNELNTLRNRLFRELEDSDIINTTVRNKPVLAKLNAASPDKNKKKIETTAPPTKVDVKKDPVVPKKIDVPKVAAPKVLKEGDLFCNAFSEIDKTYEMGLKKRDERRSSTHKEKKEIQIEDGNSTAEKTSLKQLSEKAAQLRNNLLSAEAERNVTKNSSKPVPDLVNMSNSKDLLLATPPKICTVTAEDSHGEDNNEPTKSSKEVSCTDSESKQVENKKPEDSHDKESKQKIKSSKETSNNDRETKHSEKKKTDDSPDKDNKEISKSNIDSSSNDQESINSESKKSEDSQEKNNKEKSKTSKESSDNDRESKHSDIKKDKNEKSHKTDHKKDKDDKHKDKNRDRSKKEHEKDKDRKDRSKDKSTREKHSKPSEKKDIKDKKSSDKEQSQQDSKKEKKDLDKDDPKSKAIATIVVDEKATKSDAVASKQIIPNKTDVEIDKEKEDKAFKDHLAELTKNIEDIMNAKPKSQVREIHQDQEHPQPQKKASEEIKSMNRDPRLKYGTNAVVANSAQNTTSEPIGRLAFKYNPKPKRQEIDNDLDKNVLDSIEKSMKESSVPLPPPPILTAPPAPPEDLFSPESPDEIDKAAVPPILNDLLLNPETTGVINEVVSALRRSNNEKNLISINHPVTNMRNNEPKPVGLPVLNKPQSLHFSPPSQGLKFTPPVDTSMFVQPNKMANTQSRLYNPFSPTEQGDVMNDMNIPEYHAPRGQAAHFEPPNSRLNPYEDRSNQGFYMERQLNYVPPSPIYGAPSPSYVPPSPIYEQNVDNYRDMNYQNYQGSNQQRFFEGERGTVRPKGLLGDAPRLGYNKQYGQQNYDNYSRFGPRGIPGNPMDPRSSYFGGVSRDPRINMNRAPQFPAQDQRPMCRESRMTYREYKEQKERETREREMREKEIRNKETLEKQQREREEADQKAKAAKERDETEQNQKEAEIEKNEDANSDKVEERDREGSRFGDRNERSRSRNRSRDRYSRNRSASRYRRERDDKRGRGDRKEREDRRGRSRERSRYGESKFDKVYSTRDKIDKESPLNNLFPSKTSNGKGYGSQYKIPKKPKEEEPPKEDDKKNEEPISKEIVKKDVVENKKKEVEKADKSEKTSPKKKSAIEEENDVKEEVNLVEKNETQEEKPNESKVEENKTDLKCKDEESNSTTSDADKKSESKEEKCSQSSDKKEEEENILSKFFQNLMKSSNKDEKKGALLSLISTFSDSFSDQQMQKITSIIKSEDIDEQTKKEDEQTLKEATPTTCKEEIEKTEEKESESLTADSSEIIEEETGTNTEDETETSKEVKELNDAEETVDKCSQQSTAGKLKNRRKSEAKSKIKIKSELDRLHDDIRDMFIRDGVVTATGKRMCRILKDNSAPTSTDNDKTEEEPNEEETEKKTSVVKKRGRKVGYRKTRETPDLEMKELTVVLPKMSLENIRSTDENPKKEKNEEDSNHNADKVDESKEAREPLAMSEEDASDKETELDKEKTSPIRKIRQKKRNSWATGVIKKKPKSKPKALSSPEGNNADVEHELSVDIEENQDEEIVKKDPNLHKKNYYLKIGQTKLQCKFCDVATKWIAAHYRSEHPDEEVLCSRLSPEMAKMAIKDAIQNKEVYEKDDEESYIKHDYTCCFCEYKQVTLPRMYRDHVSIHTGEFRHICPYCNFSRSHIKTMQGHVAEAHAEEEAIEKRPIVSERAPNNRNVYAYICQICNFTQMSLKNVRKHIKSYHSDEETCEIYKIKVNLEAKLEDKYSEDDNKKTVSERPTRRSAKLSQSQVTPEVEADDEDKPLKVEIVEKASSRRQKKEDSDKTKIDTPAESENNENPDKKLENESTDETEPRTRLRQTRKRAKSFSAPSPVKKRLKRKCTLKTQVSSDNADNENSEDSEEKVVKSIDVAVFTSNTDIQEENKRIEEERMKTMQDINSTIKLRTSLDFVEKLSHRLKQEEEVTVKEEVQETVEENVLEKLPANDLPVFEKSGIQNRETESASIRPESSPKTNKDVGKVNPVNCVIEKLQGILGGQSACDDIASPSVSSEETSLPAPDEVTPSMEAVPDDNPPSLEAVVSLEPPPLKFFAGEPNNHPPPLIHMDSVEHTIEKSSIINSETLNIGFIKIMKTTSTYIYVCCLPPCIFSTRDRTAFTSHCQYYHHWDKNETRTSECFECGVTLTSNQDTNLLTSALNHAVSDHSDFLGIKIGSIRISSNLFPDKPKENDDVLSDNALNPPTISIPSPPDCNTEEFDSLFDTEPITQDNEGENPFELRIVDVVSLADQNLSPTRTSDQDVETVSCDKESGTLPVQQESTPPTSPKKSTMSALLSKYQQTANTSRKTPVAFKKFLGNHFDLYKCPEYSCLFTANKRKMFDIHLSMHRNHKQLMNCLYCDKMILFKSTGDHYEKLHGMCRFSCSYCLYRCIAKDYMDIHQILAHPNMPSRMQLLPKRDSEEKNSISILSEATKGTAIKPYLCCTEEFTFQSSFIEHVNDCPENTNFSCYFKTGNSICKAPHNNARDLVQHWGACHEVYPLKCHYCNMGDFDLNAMMIHLVLEHPTLPPDILDRYNRPPKSKLQVASPSIKFPQKPGHATVHCNFKRLAIDLRASLKGPVPSPQESPQAPAVSPTVVPAKPSTMQKAFENFVVQNTQPTLLKAVSPYTKVAPINIIQTSPPGISLLKPTSKANVINAGGVVYCLSPTSTSQNQVLKAIVVNTDNTSSKVPQKVQFLPSSPTVDGKFQIVKNVSKVLPISPKMLPIASKARGAAFAHKIPMMPKLAPLTTGQLVSPVNEVVASGETLLQLTNAVEERSETNEVVLGASVPQKDGGMAEDVAEMDGLEEPMVVFRDDLTNKEQDEAVDPLSLETEAPQQPSKTPRPGSTPLHEYDSDSRDVEQQEVLVQKSGLVGYQLFRCAKCDMFFPGGWQLKDHLISSTRCRFTNVSNKPYKCYHCGKYLKHYTNLLDHLGYHGHPRFTCSLCNKKFPHANQARYHMKTQHNVLNVQMQPSIQSKSNMNCDSFIAKPQVVGSVKPVIQENMSEADTQKSTEVKTVYFSFEADQIPQKSILGYDVTCGHCKKFKNKVRSNIVRHLLLHQNDKEFSVPDTAPVNPVPCLEKNEKMFDKMYNLASSSHTGGRMGGQQKGETNKDKAKEADHHPAFVPTNKRYQCCAVGCNYLCLEEGNLRHHLTALHMEDLNFVCVHCKKDLSDAVDVDTIIKHLKLHDLHLYKCSYCDHMHNLRHKIERHIRDDHKNKEISVVVIRAMDAEPYDDNQQQPFTPVVVNQKLPKPWKCCMCKYKCNTEEDVVNHVKNKHNIDCRYKCALCTYKTNEVSEFKEHFKKNHADSEIDIISVYHKDDEGNGAVTEVSQFDTTPLWLRDKPRVRHIRGILFEDDPAMKKKSAQLKATTGDPVVKEAPGASTGKKRKRSMSTFVEPNKLDEETLEPKKEVPEVRIVNVQSNDDVIVIEDDEVVEPEEKNDKDVEAVADEADNDVDLICMFGDLGMPLNKHFKCPKCEKYKTTKMRDFIQHVAGEIGYHRFMCKICHEKFITLENIQMHCIDYHNCSVSSVAYLPVDPQINKWLTLLLKEQRTIIKGLGLTCEELPADIEDFLGRMEVIEKMIKCKECGFSVSGMQALDRHMKYNHPHIAFNQPAAPAAPEQPVAQPGTSDKKRKSEDRPENATEPKKLKTMNKANLITKDKYVCNECKAEFDSVPEMEYHGKEKHDGYMGYTVKETNIPIVLGANRNVYRCRYCPSTGTKASLEAHISSHHPGQKIDIYRFSCGVCSAKFEMLKAFRQHFKSHELSEIFFHDVHDRRVTLKPTVTTASKKWLYRCPVCYYYSQSMNSANIKHHLKIHAKPFQCEICQSQFRTRTDAKTHHLKEHPHNSEAISTREEMVQKINELMEEVLKNVTEVESTDKTDESMEDEVPCSTLQPEVILKTTENETVDVESVESEESSNSAGKRFFARKSTGKAKTEEEEYYSFYGQRVEPVDMKKIVTNFEIADAKMKMTCDQLGRIYNLNPMVKLKDCMTLIIEDDDEESS